MNKFNSDGHKFFFIIGGILVIIFGPILLIQGFLTENRFLKFPEYLTFKTYVSSIFFIVGVYLLNTNKPEKV